MALEPRSSALWWLWNWSGRLLPEELFGFAGSVNGASQSFEGARAEAIEACGLAVKAVTGLAGEAAPPTR